VREVLEPLMLVGRDLYLCTHHDVRIVTP
jgi:hypothetical protein